MKVLTIKDSEGILRPSWEIYVEPTKNLEDAVRAEFAQKQKKGSPSIKLAEKPDFNRPE